MLISDHYQWKRCPVPLGSSSCQKVAVVDGEFLKELSQREPPLLALTNGFRAFSEQVPSKLPDEPPRRR
ncbi:hypothetical protein AK812_SmicGene14742 [Symbiodinium microadriaticum]|uniref:Uncharacterized protein n=1 Tax=Symbiodinium microadriaticum TaxID=2951 RepID=A0A1Q9E4S0_SYMMI|nr:hypothetical protein AK812_SmicGene14742 [Symbiodinium microadriaticum]